MSMNVMQTMGNIAFDHGFRLLVDKITTAGKIYFGMALSGAQKSDPAWYILCLDNSAIKDFEWADREGMTNMNKKWTLRDSYTYQVD